MSRRLDSTVAEPIPVDLASVESVLTTLWRREETGPEGPQNVLTRACMSNLLIVCKGRDDARLLAAEVDAIVSRHPSRVLLLVADVTQTFPIEAAVSAHCHLSGDNRQVCSEMVSIAAGGDEIRKLPSAACSLLVGDLPTSLWWDNPEPPPLGGWLFDELVTMVDQVIYSSLNWDDAVHGTLATADWIAHTQPGDPVAIDLAWRGLRSWRQFISQSLDPASIPGAIDGLSDIEIEHGPHGLPQAWLLVGWIASALGWEPLDRKVVKGRELSWQFQKPGGNARLCVRRHDEGEPQVRRVKMTWMLDGHKAALTFAPTGSGHLGATADGLNAETRVLAGLSTSRARMLAAELEELEPDHVFQKALAVSRILAENLVFP